MKLFVTGSTGLLGSHLVRALIAHGHEVVGLIRSEEKGRRLIGDTGARLVLGDMRDVGGFAPALEGCEVVFHTASVRGPARDFGTLITTWIDEPWIVGAVEGVLWLARRRDHGSRQAPKSEICETCRRDAPS